MRSFSTVSGWLALGLCLSFGATPGYACDDNEGVQPENTQAPTGGTSGRITGLAVDPASFAVLSTDLAIVGGESCPAKAEISAIFTTNKPGKFHYLIGTSAGPNKHGVLDAKKVGNLYRAQAVLMVDVVKSGTLKVHAIALDFPDSEAAVSKKYKCGVNGFQAN